MTFERTRRRRAAIILCVIAILSSRASSAEPGARATVETGTLQGVSADGVESFKGIPYAAAPVGALRWRAPRAAAPWKGVRAAAAFGNVCISPPSDPDDFAGRPPQSEDCLTLNIWRPAGKAAARLPVLVWIHGGGLIAGSSAYPVYDGAAFARRGIILVSLNYRLGAFGVFAHPALTRENADGGWLANYGLMDQIAALRWIKRNIAAFDGDPNRVTIFGESAGALSVDTLMAIPAARGLFRAAISESGYGRKDFQRLSGVPAGQKVTAEDFGVALMRSLGVSGDDPAALRAVPAQDIRAKAEYGGVEMFVIDGGLVTEDLWDYYRKGEEAPIPFILGSNSLEFPPPDDPKPSEAKILDDRLSVYVRPDELDRLIPVYGGRENLRENLTSDILFGEQARALAAMHAANGHPTWRYLFSAVAPSVAGKFKGARHASELPYVFNTLPAAHWPMSPRDQALADAMTAYWVAFARDGMPDATGLPDWPEAQGDAIIDFTDDGPKPTRDPRGARFDSLGAIADKRS
jgi:para-nitrobenzyl esterase